MRSPYGLDLIDSCRACKLKSEGFFCNVSPAALKAFEAIKYTTAYPQGAVLFLEGQEPGAPVTDRTGLTGAYAISLHWTPERFRLTGVGVAPSNGESGIDPNGPSIMTALREQLGLRLEKTTSAIEHVTIERAERPSPN